MERAHVPVLEALASIPERRLSDWRCPVDHAGTVLHAAELRDEVCSSGWSHALCPAIQDPLGLGGPVSPVALELSL